MGEIVATKEIEGVTLTVDPVNAAAIKLYARKGFAESELVPEYYGEGQDRVLMVRKPAEESRAPNGNSLC